MAITGLEAPMEDPKRSEALQVLLGRLRAAQNCPPQRQDVEMTAAFDACRVDVGRGATEVGPALWHQVLIECAKVPPKLPQAFLAMAQLVSELQGARRARLPSHVFHDITDVLCRSPMAQKPQVVSALASLVLGNVSEVPARVTRLMQVFEGVVENSQHAEEASESENAGLVALQGMANLCYIEEGTQVSASSDYLRSPWLPRLIGHFAKNAARSYNALAGDPSMSPQRRFFHLRQMKACLVGLSFLFCRQPKLDLDTVRTLLLQLRAVCALGVARLVMLPSLNFLKTESLCSQGQELATGRSPGVPLLSSVKSKTGPSRKTSTGVGAVLAVGSRAEFRHAPQPLESRLKELKVTEDAELAEMLPSEGIKSEWDLLVSDAESSDSEVELAPGNVAKSSVSPERALSNKVSAPQ